MATNIQLKDPSLLVGQNYIDGKWVEAVSGKRFNVTGKLSTPNNFLIRLNTDYAVLPQTLRAANSSDLVRSQTPEMR